MSDPAVDPIPALPADPSPPPSIDPAAPPLREPHDSRVVVETVEGEIVTLVGSLTQIFPQTSGPVPFSIESTWTLMPEHEEEIRELFVTDENVDHLLADLEKRRILLVSGEAGAGMGTMAKYLSVLVAGRKRPTLVVGALDPQVPIDIRKLAQTSKEFGQRATVFTNVFQRKNRDLLGFFARIERAGWEQLAASLRQSHSYLIFTAEVTALAGFRQQTSEGIASCTLPSPTRDLVERALDRRIGWMRQKQLAGDEHLRTLRERRTSVLEAVRTIPQLALFLGQYVAGDPDIDAAIQRFNDVGGTWFSKELTADTDAWCFVLTLALAIAAQQDQSVGWYEFERIRRAVTEKVKSDAEIFPRRRRPEAAQEFDVDERTAGQSLTDDLLLSRCRAVIAKDSSRLGDVVRFIDPSYADRIWQVLLTRNRRVLTALLPTLRTLAEDERGPGTYAVRALAAQMIGRLGELDPFSISMPLAQYGWAGDRTQRSFVGRLLLGMRASSNSAYKNAALGAVDTLTTENIGDSAAGNDRLLTAISAYSQLGEHEPQLAMERLGTIATQKLAPVMTDLHQVERVVEKVNLHLSRPTSQSTAEDLLFHRFRLGRLANQLNKRHAATLLALKQAVVYLCLMGDPVQILRMMRDWISKGGSPSGTLVALLFLHGGIAEDLDTVATNAHSLTGQTVVNPIVSSLANSPNAVHHFCAFLADVYTSLNKPFSLPAELQYDMRQRFGEALTAWARVSLSSPTHRDAMKNLFISLANVRDRAIHDDIYDLFAAPAFKDDAALAAFAAEVRRERFSLAGGGR
jgi:hypothetical protein